MNTANPINCFEDRRSKSHGSGSELKVSSIVVRRKMTREAQRTGNGTLASASLPRSGGPVEVGFRKKEKLRGGEDVRGEVHSRDIVISLLGFETEQFESISRLQ
jgi:hypothetical protein